MDERTYGHWRLGRKLGEGSFGAVYEAENTVVAGRTAAVKLLHRDMAQNEDVRNRFLNEASAASRAEHENIIQVFDGGTTDDGTCYVVTELLKGRRWARCSPPGASTRCAHCASGPRSRVPSAPPHRAGIVHRDLKPDNVFLVRHDAEEDFVKVLDFGVAQLQDARRTMAGIAIGTPAYMAPEQWEARDVDRRADIYALGLMLYELLAGRRPFEVSGDFAWIAAHTATPPPVEPLGEAAPEVRTLVLHLLAKRREQRPQSMDEVVRALESAIALLQPPETFTIRGSDGDTGTPAAAPVERWVVQVTSGGREREVPVPRTGEITIGSRKGNIIRLEGEGVAPWHARLTRAGSQFFLEERERGAGLLLNGRPVAQRMPVARGDVIRVAAFELALRPAGSADRPRRNLLAWAAVVAASAVALGGLALVGVRVRADMQARDLEAQLARLNVEADRALKALDWDAAIARADDGLKLSFTDETLRDKRLRAVTERSARNGYDRFVAATHARDFDRAMQEWRSIPAASVYRNIAEAMRSDVFDGYVVAHVEKARTAQQAGKCDEVKREAEAVLLIDDDNSAILEMVRACASLTPSPSPPPAASPAPRKQARGKTGPAKTEKSLGTELLMPR